MGYNRIEIMMIGYTIEKKWMQEKELIHILAGAVLAV
jgi:hypothetical protein